MCGDSFGTRSDPTWPTIYTYSVNDAPTEPPTPVLAEAAGERVTYFRRDIHSGWGSCSSPLNNDAQTDHHVLAQMLGLSDEALQFRTYEHTSIEWQTDDQFYYDAERAVKDEEAKFNTAADALHEKLLITAGEMSSARPKLSVEVDDERNPKGRPLPELRFSDPRTTLAPPPQSFPLLPETKN